MLCHCCQDYTRTGFSQTVSFPLSVLLPPPTPLHIPPSPPPPLPHLAPHPLPAPPPFLSCSVSGCLIRWPRLVCTNCTHYVIVDNGLDTIVTWSWKEGEGRGGEGGAQPKRNDINCYPFHVFLDSRSIEKNILSATKLYVNTNIFPLDSFGA